MDMELLVTRRDKCCTHYWICFLFLFNIMEKVAVGNQISQKSDPNEEINHYGTEFILGMTDYERILYIASEQRGTYNLSVPDSNISETGSLVIGSTKVNVDSHIYPGFRKGSGLSIVTSVLVSICVSDKENANRDGVFLALPSQFAGKLYMVPAYKSRFFGIVVAALHENTNIAVAHFLDKTETVILPEVSDTFTTIGYEEDIASTVILANKPVSVMTGTSRDEGESHSSILVEQVLPFNAWTNEYIIPPLPPNSKYMIRVMTMENQTVCFKTNRNTTCNEVSSVSNMNYVLSTEALVVTSLAPVSIIQHGTDLCNKAEYDLETFPFMILIPGIDNYLNKYSFVIPAIGSGVEHFVTVIIPLSKVSGLLIDGSLVSFDYSYRVTASLGDYGVLIKNISPGYHVVYHSDPWVVFGAIAYGSDGPQCSSSTTRSYGFALGYTFKRTMPNSMYTQTTERSIGFSGWNEWSKCSTSCDAGNQFRERTCTTENFHNQLQCSGHKSETRQCLLRICEDNSVFVTWTSWSVCSMSCGGGVQSREGVCLKTGSTNKACHIQETLIETRRCNVHHCPVDGGFTDWSIWSDCSVTCDTGLHDRARKCENPPPSSGGRNCFGAREEAKSCLMRACKDDGISSDDLNSDLIIILSVVFGVILLVGVSVFLTYRIRKKRRIKKDAFVQYDAISTISNARNSGGASSFCDNEGGNPNSYDTLGGYSNFCKNEGGNHNSFDNGRDDSNFCENEGGNIDFHEKSATENISDNPYCTVSNVSNVRRVQCLKHPRTVSKA